MKRQLNVKYVDISNSSDIDDSKYNELLEKQKQNKATKTDKLKIEKFIIKNMLGLDIVDEVIVKHYYKHDHILKNFTALIDPLNIRDNDEIVRLQRAEKTELIKNIINYMGFDSENIFNRSALGQIGCESLFSTINILKRFALQIRFHVWNQDFVWRLDHGILGSSS